MHMVHVDTLLKWFENYLYDRSQYVVYNNEYSETLPIKCGVPQGSILGTLFFIIYLNDICNILLFLNSTSCMLMILQYCSVVMI